MLVNNFFFKPTNLYREFLILDLVEKNQYTTQRDIAKKLNLSVSMINNYLENYINNKLVIMQKTSSKYFKYILTNKGIERKKFLNLGYLRSTQKLYKSAKENIVFFLDQIKLKNFKKIILYGAGEVAEIFLNTIRDNYEEYFDVIAIIDDDKLKQGSRLLDVKIISIDDLKEFTYDGIFISSYNSNKLMRQKLNSRNISDIKIIQFFN